MTYKSAPSLWDLNKASVFVEAMTAASRADQSHAGHAERHLRSHVKGAKRPTTPSAFGRLTPRLAAATVGVAVVAAITLAN